MAKFCSNCGKEVQENQAVCLNCGFAINGPISSDSNAKSKLIAGLLGILLGSLGVHNFYLGYTNKGVTQLLLTLIGWIVCGLGPIIAGIWGLVEGIQILIGSISTDADGNPLKD